MKPYSRKDRRGYRNLAASAVAAGIMFMGGAAVPANAKTMTAQSTKPHHAPANNAMTRSDDETYGDRLGDLLRDAL